MKQLPQSSPGLHTAVDTFQFCIQASILSVFQQVGLMGDAEGQARHLVSWTATSGGDGAWMMGEATQLRERVAREMRIESCIV